MRRKIAICFLTALVLLLGSACEGKAEASAPNKAGTAEKSGQVKVTFIELGSVNCIPCKMMQPVMDDLRREYPRDVKVVFYDVWTEAGRPYGRQYGIRAIPTQVFLDAEGKEFYRHEGFFPKEQLVQVLKKKGVEK